MTDAVLQPVETFATLPVAKIVPSPFQHRRTFDQAALAELGRSIAADGLLQPITVRQVGEGYELIAGERRWRAATEHAGLTEILARVLKVDDLQARRLCATENLQRSDLTPIEEVMAMVELIDAELLMTFGGEYRAFAKIDEPRWRVKGLLTAIESDRRNETEKVTHKFVGKTEAVFSGLPKPKERRSFTDHDLPLLFTADEVQQFAMEHKLNKSQTKAVAELHKAAPEIFRGAAPDKVFEKVVEKVVEASLPDFATDQERLEAIKAAKESADGMRYFSANEITKATKKAKEQESGRQQNIIALKWTGDAEGYTPQSYVEHARTVLGGIDCDPASNPIAQKIVCAERYYTAETNGLDKDWIGRVFLNPPYEHPTIAQFIDRLLHQFEVGNTTAAILLTNNNTDTIWFHKAASMASAICFTRGRINFYKPDGKISQPTNGQAFFYFGKDVAAFRRVFGESVGLVVEVAE